VCAKPYTAQQILQNKPFENMDTRNQALATMHHCILEEANTKEVGETIPIEYSTDS
jgi:hypothetical protein